MRPRPASGVEELVLGRRKRSQVRLVLSEALVDDGVQLEVDLIDAAREMNGQRRAYFRASSRSTNPVRVPEVRSI